MTRFAELSETFKQDAGNGNFSTAADQLFTEAFKARQEWDSKWQPEGYRAEVAAATQKLEEDGVLPMLSAQYLSISSDGQTNFEDIADNGTDDGVIDREELDGQIETLEGNDAQFSAAMAKELKSNFTEIAMIDGESGISMSDYHKYIASEAAKLKGESADGTDGDESASASYEVKAGDGFDRIARSLYKEAFGEKPSVALEIELSRRIAELNGNDRDYGQGFIQPGQTLKVFGEDELRRIVEELQS
ncbi:MAG: hypothetical protein IT342_26355 [Candidatus Melainabacteria bacterium]|nr:hypothetical protein [Candidatus Melainabacteria bacterium]